MSLVGSFTPDGAVWLTDEYLTEASERTMNSREDIIDSSLSSRVEATRRENDSAACIKRFFSIQKKEWSEDVSVSYSPVSRRCPRTSK